MIYCSTDIETTGLDPSKHQIMEIACVLDDALQTGIEKDISLLPSLRLLCIRDDWLVDPYCAWLHHDLWHEMGERKDKTVGCWDFAKQDFPWPLHGDYAINTGGEAGPLIAQWLKANGVECPEKTTPTRCKAGRPKITMAGKNFASFDWQFLKTDCFKIDWSVDIRHRTIDVAPMYWQPGDKVLPDTKTCMKRAGLDGIVKHTALEDARNVVRLVRDRMLKSFH